MPPSFLLRPIRRPPKNIGRISSGHRPHINAEFTKSVEAERKSEPDSRQRKRSFRCWGRRPSGPPAKSDGNERTAFLTLLSVTAKWSVWFGTDIDELQVAETFDWSNRRAFFATEDPDGCGDIAIFQLCRQLERVAQMPRLGDHGLLVDGSWMVSLVLKEKAEIRWLLLLYYSIWK